MSQLEQFLGACGTADATRAAQKDRMKSNGHPKMRRLSQAMRKGIAARLDERLALIYRESRTTALIAARRCGVCHQVMGATRNAGFVCQETLEKIARGLARDGEDSSWLLADIFTEDAP